MFCTLFDRRGWRAAAGLLCVCIGCATPAPPAGQPRQLELTATEEQHAAALAHYATAVSLAATAGMTAALPEYQRAYALDAGNLSLGFMLAEYYRTHGDMTNAVAILDRAIAVNPQSPEPWVAKGLTYRGAEDATNAITAFQQALRLDPAHYGAVRALVETYLVLDDTNNVASLLDKSFRQHSSDASYWTVLGDLYSLALRQKPLLAAPRDRTPTQVKIAVAPRTDSAALAGHLNPARTRQCYEHALALAPRNPEILLRVGDAYLNADDFTAAADTYAKLLELRPNLPQVRERLAAVYLKTDQKAKAITVYKELIKQDPLRFDYCNVLGELCEESAKLDEALSFFEQSLKLNPDQSDRYAAICELQHRLKRPAAVVVTLAAWKKRFPVDWRVPYFQAYIEVGNKEYAKAIVAYADAEILAREAPQEVKLNAQFYFSYGAACERAGDRDKAAVLFRKVIATDAKFANAYNYLGYMWADNDTNLTAALELIQQAVTFEPDNSAFRDSLGWVLHKLGRDTEALAELRRAVASLDKETKADSEERQDDAVVYDHLADVLLQLGQPAEAVAMWQRGLKLDPGNHGIAAKLAAHAPPPK